MLELKSTIEQFRMGYRTYPGKSRAFEIVLRDYYERLRTSQSSTRDLIEKSFPALAGALSQPELVDQALLVNYIAELIRLVENVGLGFTFGQYFIDQAINVYRQINQPLIDLY